MTETGWSPDAIRDQVLDYAGREDGFEALRRDGGDALFDRLKLVGLYHQKQEGNFMFRTKIPGGVLTAEQARTIGEVAAEFARGPEPNPVYGDGLVDVTTRQDTQKHWIQLEDVPEIWERYDDVGLTSMQACGNSVRNVVGCPAAGLGDDELSVQEVVDEITAFFVGDDHYANLPRKLKVSVTGCRHDCAESAINDIGFTPAAKDGRTGFNVRIGGGLSDAPRIAEDLDLFVAPDDAVELVRATAEAFIELGSYPDAAVNRLRFLVAEHGVEALRDEIAEHAEFALESAGEDLTEDRRRDHVGVHDQADGRNYVGLSVTAGRMRGESFVRAAELAREYGEDELRLTTSQNLLIPHVADGDLDALLEEPLLEEHGPSPEPFSRGVVTCTGREFCSFGVVETKNRAKRWAEQLDEAAGDAVDDSFRLHFSGCKASCAQPQIGDVGLRGATYRDEAGTGEAADVGLGGTLDGEPRFADWLEGRVPIEDVPDAVERLARRYDTSGADSFAAFVDATPERELRAIVRGDQEVEA